MKRTDKLERNADNEQQEVIPIAQPKTVLFQNIGEDTA
jgi:hypothetical protein